MIKGHVSYIVSVNGAWSVWSPWSQCTVSCGGGIRQRARDCSNPATLYGGLECDGVDWQNMICMTDECPGTHNSISLYIRDHMAI